MSGSYRAWNGKTYRWPPPDGWYRAADGRWWAPGSGPNPPPGQPRPGAHPSPSPVRRTARRPSEGRRRFRLAVVVVAITLAGLAGGAVAGLLATSGTSDGSGEHVDAGGPSTRSSTTATPVTSRSTGTDRTGESTTPSNGNATGSSQDRTAATSTTVAQSVTSEPPANDGRAERVTRFRELMTADELSSEPLTDQDIEDLAETLCVIATIENTTGFATTRSRIAAEQAQQSTLGPVELSAAINAAVRAFCPADARRLGL